MRFTSRRRHSGQVSVFNGRYSGARVDEVDEDARSFESFSSTATIDDNPGTGRVLDKYFFQLAGRRIERFAMRVAIRHLHPSRIFAFIDGVSWGHLEMEYKSTLGDVLSSIDREDSGSTVIAGLKSLVRQAQ